MKIIAITGGIGSGKTTVLNEFRTLGAMIISCDEISHRIMKKGERAYNEVRLAFGDEILAKDGEIDRALLAKAVFSDDKKLKKLNSITHRIIYEEIKKELESISAEVVCIEIPLLFSADCPIEIDITVAVVADKELRIKRTMARDGISREQVEARMKKQLTDEEMSLLADIVIKNNGDKCLLSKTVEEIYNS